MADKYQKYLTSPPIKDKEMQTTSVISLIQRWKAWKGVTAEHQGEGTGTTILKIISNI